MADNNLGNEWKDTVYELGGAFVSLGTTLLHSIKKGVDVAYDFMNEEETKKKKQDAARKKTASERSASEKASEESDEAETVEGIIIEEE